MKNIEKFSDNIFIKHLFYWLFTIAFIAVLSNYSLWIEKIYSQKLYPLIAVINRWLASFFPFSIGDLLYFWGVMYFFYLILILLIQIKKPQHQLKSISVFLLKTVWIFYLSWGFNYFRKPLNETLPFSNDKYNMEELLQVTDSIIKRSNKLQMQLSRNDSLPVSVPYGIEHILAITPQGYKEIENLTKTAYKVPCIKTSLFSKQISYMGITGYLNPFTGEAQINKLYPKVYLPFVASHEVAHQLGFAPENEANFLGYLASIHHPDPYFNYSGNISALFYLLNEIRKADSETFKRYFKKLNKGIVKNFKEAYRFNKKYQFPIDFSKGYDVYLKLNKQKSGIQSYNEMVKLVIAYELKK